ncbi:MAG: response regulator, partial [Chloroflexota bacterium]
LIVDDNSTHLNVLSNLLNRWHIEVVEAISSAEALHILRRDQAFSFALIDYKMPGAANGLALAKEMNKLSPIIPVIILSSSFENPSGERPANINGWLYKPIKIERLLEAFNQILLKTGKEREIFETATTLSLYDPEFFDPQRRLKILLVEDNVVNQRVFLNMLNKQGYVCDLASDGEEALEAVRRQPYDIVFMDLYMPNLDGFDASIKIRQLDVSQPSLIALSAEINPAIVNKLKTVGIEAAIQKPAKIKEILKTISKIAREKLLHKE